MNYKIFFILVFLVGFFAGNANQNIINNIYEEVGANDGQVLILYLVSASDCHSCYAVSHSAIQCLLNKPELSEHSQIVALVNCDRKKELSIFTERYNWKEAALVNKNQFYQKQFKVDNSITLIVISKSDGILATFKDKTKNLCDKLEKIIIDNQR